MNAEAIRAILNAAAPRDQRGEIVEAWARESSTSAQEVKGPVGRSGTGVSLAFFTPTQFVFGLTDSKGQRLSEVVNSNHSSYIAVHDVTARDLLSGDAPRSLSEVMIRKDVLHLVVPQDNDDMLRPRVSTRRMALELTTGFFRIRGGLYRRDSDPTNLVQLMSGYTRQFIPFADVTIEYLLNSAVRTTGRVALLNTQHLQYWAVLPESE